MADIGSISCDLVRGGIRDLKERIVTWQLPGINGYGVQKLGTGNSECNFTGLKFGTSAAVETWIGQIEGTQGSVVTVVDDWGVSYTNCLITHVGQPRKTARVNHDGNGVCMGEVEISGIIV